MDGVGTYERACIETASASSTVLQNYGAGAGSKEAMLITMKLRSGMLRPVPTTPAAICHRSPGLTHLTTESHFITTPDRSQPDKWVFASYIHNCQTCGLMGTPWRGGSGSMFL